MHACGETASTGQGTSTYLERVAARKIAVEKTACDRWGLSIVGGNRAITSSASLQLSRDDRGRSLLSSTGLPEISEKKGGPTTLVHVA